jgi:glutamine synthetase
VTPGRLDGFVQREGCWGDDEHAAHAQLRRVVDEAGIELFRVCFTDQHGVLRGKTLTRDAFASALRDGVTAPSSLLLKDTSGRSAYPVFSAGGGIDVPGMGGAGDVVLVPDPHTFRPLPWAPRTASILCDLSFPGGGPVPLSTREICRRALRALADRGYDLVAGVELEFHVFRTSADAVPGQSAPGRPGRAPELVPVSRGAQLLEVNGLDALDDVVQFLHDGLTALDLPLRSIELEFGPNQLEVTLAPRPALAAADDVVLCRSAIQQLCARHGYLATFMSRPLGALSASSGWHLHQSLLRRGEGGNAMVPETSAAALSDVGLAYLAGLLRHAPAATVLTTPTVNGYKRYQPQSLAPDRIVWGIDNKGAMVRAVGGAGDPATRLENRCGEPAANPYLYVASQAVAGLAGIDGALDPGPPTATPYTADAPRLPTDLGEAIEALRADQVFARGLGQGVVDWLLRLKSAELERFRAEVSDWEQREYLTLI